MPLLRLLYRLRPVAGLLAALLLLSGCGKVALFSSLTETEANEMMAILLQRGVDCTKAAGKDGVWILQVKSADFARSVELLRAQGYPKDTFTTVGRVFQKSGLVSSPTEERIRYMYALSQEISETLTRVDGVMNARVHIVIPDNDPLAERVTPSSAAVFIRYRQGFDLESLTPQLKGLVTRSIEGLSYDNVSLVLVPAVPAPAAATAPRVQNGGMPATDPLVLGAFLLAGAALGAGGFWLVRRSGTRRPAGAEAAA
jgi:type III secretion protein J